jgi:hypothetical protein
MRSPQPYQANGYFSSPAAETEESNGRIRRLVKLDKPEVGKVPHSLIMQPPEFVIWVLGDGKRNVFSS